MKQIQVILGSSKFEGGPISSYFNASIESADFNYDRLTELILDGLRRGVELFTDSSIIDSISQTNLSTVYDLFSLQYVLKQQNIYLIVSEVNSNVIVDGVNTIVKFTSPVSYVTVPRALDFAFNTISGKVDIPDTVKQLSENFNLFDSSLFLTSPIDEIVNSINTLEESGIPSDSATSELIQIVKDMGFSVNYIIINE